MQYAAVFLKVNEVDQFWDKVSDTTKRILENLDGLTNLERITELASHDVNTDASQPVEQLNVSVKVVDDGENRTADYNLKFLKVIHDHMHNYSITIQLHGAKFIAEIVNYTITKDECCIIFNVIQNADNLITKLKKVLKSLLRKQSNQTHEGITVEDNEDEISTCFDCVYCYYNPYYDATGTRGYECALAKRRIIDDWDWSDSRNPNRLNCRVNSLPTPNWCPLKQKNITCRNKKE